VKEIGHGWKNGGGTILKMKLFAGQGEAAELEKEVNQWLKENPYITLKEIGQSYASNGDKLFALMSVWYDS
jgi:DNA-directed RNA polymerase specialized sigma54-like protein